MHRSKVYVTGRGLITCAGRNPQSNWVALCQGKSALSFRGSLPMGKISGRLDDEIGSLRRDKLLKLSDRAGLLGIVSAYQAVAEGGVRDLDNAFVAIGSSRGTIETFEQGYKGYLESADVAQYLVVSSGMSSLSAVIAYEMGSTGATISVSSACASALHAIGLGAMSLRAGQSPAALVGGTEAPLTPFNFEQYKSCGIVRDKEQSAWPYKPLHAEKDGPCFGEGAGCLLLETEPTSAPLATVAGYGAAIEDAMVPGLSSAAEGLQRALHQALEQAQMTPDDVDLVIGHGSGTAKGESAELAAYQAVFGERMPALSFNKWLFGHMLGASGAASAVLACSHIQHDYVPGHPYLDAGNPHGPDQRRRVDAVAVTALGFGGNAAAVILARA